MARDLSECVGGLVRMGETENDRMSLQISLRVICRFHAVGLIIVFTAGVEF